MQFLLFVLIIIVCLFLALVVLIQNPKGGGLDSSFSSANQIGGVKRTADFLEKSTWSLVIVLFVLCLASAGMQDGGLPTEDNMMFQERQMENQQDMPEGEQMPDEEIPTEDPLPE